LQIGNYVDDPHQKFVIEFKGKHEFIFHIELISLMGNAVKGDEYPKLVKSVGPSPFKKDDLLKHLDKKGKHTEEYGVDGEDDDMDGMGNEGEEEENDENAEETDGEMGEESGSDEFDF